MMALDGSLIAGRFQLEARQADQGRFEVHRAVELTSRRRVLVRLMNGDDSILRAEIERAAKAMMRLPHPGLVPVLDAGVHLGRAYLVTPLIEAPTLEQTLASGAEIGLPQALKILAQIGEALEHAHKGGVCHGALGPATVLILLDGRAVLADVGFAHWIELIEQRGRASASPPPLPSTAADLEALARLSEILLARRPSVAPPAPASAASARPMLAVAPPPRPVSSLPSAPTESIAAANEGSSASPPASVVARPPRSTEPGDPCAKTVSAPRIAPPLTARPSNPPPASRAAAAAETPTAPAGSGGSSASGASRAAETSASPPPPPPPPLASSVPPPPLPSGRSNSPARAARASQPPPATSRAGSPASPARDSVPPGAPSAVPPSRVSVPPVSPAAGSTSPRPSAPPSAAPSARASLPPPAGEGPSPTSQPTFSSGPLTGAPASSSVPLFGARSSSSAGRAAMSGVAPGRTGEGPAPARAVESSLRSNQRVAVPVEAIRPSHSAATAPPPVPPVSSTFPVSDGDVTEEAPAQSRVEPPPPPPLSVEVAPPVAPAAVPPPLPPPGQAPTIAMEFGGPRVDLGPEPRNECNDTLPMASLTRRAIAFRGDDQPDMSRYTPVYVRVAHDLARHGVELWDKTASMRERGFQKIGPVWEKVGSAAGPTVRKARERVEPMVRRLLRAPGKHDARTVVFTPLDPSELSDVELRSAAGGWSALSRRQRGLAIAGVAIVLWFLVWVLSGPSTPAETRSEAALDDRAPVEAQAPAEARSPEPKTEGKTEAKPATPSKSEKAKSNLQLLREGKHLNR